MHSAEDWDDLLLPEIDRQQAEGKRVAFRADAAFAKPEIYDALETRDVDYAIRMPANRSLELEIEVNTFESRVGQLRFEYGYPTEETATTLYDELDFQRAVQVYLWSLPLVSMQAFHERLHEVDESLYAPAIFEDLLAYSTVVFTGNSTTLYAIHTPIIERDDPVVLEISADNVLGMINNAWQQPLTDLGPPGPDRGQGGKYLILPPEYDGPIPDGYFAIQSDSYQVYWLLRSFDTGPAVSRSYGVYAFTVGPSAIILPR